MASISRKAPKLAIAVAVAGVLCLIGWVANATLAQDPQAEACSFARSATHRRRAASTPQDLDVRPKSNADVRVPCSASHRPGRLG